LDIRNDTILKEWEELFAHIRAKSDEKINLKPCNARVTNISGEIMVQLNTEDSSNSVL
jgi:DNA gyrase inhibitor GyrI